MDIQKINLLKKQYIPFNGKTGNRFRDLSGQHIGMTTFLYRMENDNINKPKYVCQCDCGKIFTIHKSFSDCYRNNQEVNISCGCKGGNLRIGEKQGI